MGKRKRTEQTRTKAKTDSGPPSADNMPCSSETESLCKEKSLRIVDSTELKPLTSGIDVTDNSAKLFNAHPPLAHHHYNLSRSIFLKRSRHYYGHQYSRRNSGNNPNASTSHGKTPPSRDERLSFKLASLCNSDTGCGGENREKAFNRPDRIRSRSLVTDAVSSDMVKMVCGICQKLLRRKPYILGDGLSTGEYAVVAILICGHAYHADCLEERTCLGDRRDPPCPLCSGLLLEIDPSRRQD